MDHLLDLPDESALALIRAFPAIQSVLNGGGVQLSKDVGVFTGHPRHAMEEEVDAAGVGLIVFLSRSGKQRLYHLSAGVALIVHVFVIDALYAVIGEQLCHIRARGKVVVVDNGFLNLFGTGLGHGVFVVNQLIGIAEHKRRNSFHRLNGSDGGIFCFGVVLDEIRKPGEICVGAQAGNAVFGNGLVEHFLCGADQTHIHKTLIHHLLEQLEVILHAVLIPGRGDAIVVGVDSDNAGRQAEPLRDTAEEGVGIAVDGVHLILLAVAVHVVFLKRAESL